MIDKSFRDFSNFGSVNIDCLHSATVKNSHSRALVEWKCELAERQYYLVIREELKKMQSINHSILSKNTPLDEIISGVHLTATTPFETAPLFPQGAFHSEELLQLEKDRLFGDEWICVGRMEEFEKPGSFVTAEINEISILCVRQQDGSIRSFINACAHRRAQLTRDREGSKTRFTCPYHAWTFGIDGNLVRAPFMTGCDRLDNSNTRLTPVRTEIWAGFVFVTLNDRDETISIESRLRAFSDDIIGQYRLERYETVLKDEMTANGNWKNLIENFMESYHVFAAHKGTFATAGKMPEDYICGDQHDWVAYHLGTKPSEEGTGGAHPDDPTLAGIWRRRSVVFCVFPSLLVYAAPDLLWYMSVQPKGVDRFQARWAAAIPREISSGMSETQRSELIAKVSSFMDTANDEDLPLVEALFAGTQSTLSPSGHFHAIERNVWDFARYFDRMLSGRRA
jgi:phenylpropionate dioxygenase-like ring-hydroxylating dioxygenase large terminal subunit